MQAEAGIGFFVHKRIEYSEADPDNYKYVINMFSLKFSDPDNMDKLHTFLNKKYANSLIMNDDWNLIPDRSIKDIKIWWTKEDGRQFYDADFAK